MDYEQIMAGLHTGHRKRLAVAAAQDSYVLGAVDQATRRGLITPILVGDSAKIEAAAKEAGIDPTGMEIIDAADEAQAAATAVRLVREGRADMLMKGLMQTATLLRAILNKETGLRKSSVLSHVSVLHSPILRRMLLLTDAAMVPYPDLPTKVEMIHNAVEVAHGLGIALPRVAALAAVEVVNPQMQATVDAALLTQMNRRGQIAGCVVDGPLAMDLALSEEAARHKGVVSEVAGRADILLAHDIDVGNSVLKTFTHAGGCLFGGILMGAAAPVVLTSRSDSPQSKLYSIACAAAICGKNQQGECP